MSADIKPYCKNSPLFCAGGMWNRHLPMGSSITSTPIATPCFCKILLSRSRKISNCQSRVQKVRICWHCSQIKVTMGFPFAYGTQKRWIVAALWQLSPFKFGGNSWQVSFTKCKTFPTVYTVAQFSQKSILSRIITKSLSRPRTSQKLQS